MNPKQIVKISNILGLVSTLLLVYWVFTFITIQVFDLKVFQRGLTELFSFSILAILAVIAGSLVINVMFNLTRMAQKHNLDTENKGGNRKAIFSFVLLFPLILAVLFGGHHYTMAKKQELMIASAKSIVNMYKEQNSILLDYAFTKEYIKNTADILTLYTKTDDNFRHVEVIQADRLLAKDRVYLAFSNYSYDNSKDKDELNKVNFIRSTSYEEREYLDRVFSQEEMQIRYSFYQGKVELFYPYTLNGKTMVLYFSDYQRYGKLSSY